MSSSITMLGTPVNLVQVTWQVAVPTALPILIGAMVPTVSASPIPCMLVAATPDSARLQMMVVPGTKFEAGSPATLMDSKLQAMAAGVVE